MVEALGSQHMNQIARNSIGPKSSGDHKANVDPSAVAEASNRSLVRQIQDLPKIQEVKSMPILNTTRNFVLKNVSRLFKIAGFAGATLSVVTYFLFNLKSLAVLFGIPAVMSFYIAHTAGKSVNSEDAEFSTNPHQILKNAVANPGHLETNLVPILQSVEQIKDLKDSDPKKSEGLDLIEKLNVIVDSKLQQLEGFEDHSSIAVRNELERFKIAYDEMKNNQLATQQKYDMNTNDPIADLHRQAA